MERLPNDVLVVIFSKLDMKSRATTAAVCRDWFAVHAQDSGIWEAVAVGMHDVAQPVLEHEASDSGEPGCDLGSDLRTRLGSPDPGKRRGMEKWLRARVRAGGVKQLQLFTDEASLAHDDSAVQQGLSTLDGVGYDGVQPQWETMTESERSSHLRLYPLEVLHLGKLPEAPRTSHALLCHNLRRLVVMRQTFSCNGWPLVEYILRFPLLEDLAVILSSDYGTMCGWGSNQANNKRKAIDLAQQLLLYAGGPTLRSLSIHAGHLHDGSADHHEGYCASPGDCDVPGNVGARLSGLTYLRLSGVCCGLQMQLPPMPPGLMVLNLDMCIPCARRMRSPTHMRHTLNTLTQLEHLAGSCLSTEDPLPPSITSLQLDLVELTASGQEVAGLCRSLRGMTALRALNIREYALGGVSPSGRVLGDVLAECLTPTVTQLRILSCGLRHLPPALLALPQLKVLELSWNNPLVVDSAWSRLSGLTQLQALESLRVAYSTPLGSPFGGYPTLERMPALRSLEVGAYPEPGLPSETEESIWQGPWVENTAAICAHIAPVRAQRGLPPVHSGCNYFGKHAHPREPKYRMPEPPPFQPRPCRLLPGAQLPHEIDFAWPVFGL
mmetsp:Transcript_10065/g.30126  ORF Transcript_10065/g.30126 Transcript_10065/m.30126 type:complete len:608 (+) Transcript_10065:259-2082(+)